MLSNKNNFRAKNSGARDHPILKNPLRASGLKFWGPTNSESRSESCSENRVFTQIRPWVPFRELLRECPGIPRVAPRMAFALRERSLQNWGGSQVSEK